MRTDTLWGGERRAARMHWWRQVLDRPAPSNWDELLDEMVLQRFRIHEAQDHAPALPGGFPAH